MSKWEMVKLGEVCLPKQWKTISTSELTDEGYPVYGANGVIGFFDNYTHEKETLLVTCRGATCGSLNICTPFSYVNGNAMALDSLNSNMDLKFLFYYLKNRGFEDVISGSAQPQIIRSAIQKVEIPLPPLEAQKKIADELDKITALVEKRKSQIEKLDMLVKSKFMNFVATNSPNYSKWKEKRIEEICEDRKGSMRTGPFGSSLLHSEFVDSGVFVLGIDNAVENKFTYNKMRYITKEKYEKLKNYTVKPNDVIITIMGTVGRSAVVPNDITTAINTKHLACLTLEKKLVNPVYIAYCIHSHPVVLQQIKNNSKGAIMDGLNLTLIKAIKFPIPPLALQNKFAKYVEQIESTRYNMEKGLTQLETLYKQRMQNYFE